MPTASARWPPGCPRSPALQARLTGNQASAAQWVQRLSGTHETILDADLSEWHDYRLEWRRDAAQFLVDGELVSTVPDAPRVPLGFVASIDDQYAVATPRGTLHFGALNSGPDRWRSTPSSSLLSNNLPLLCPIFARRALQEPRPTSRDAATLYDYEE